MKAQPVAQWQRRALYEAAINVDEPKSDDVEGNDMAVAEHCRHCRRVRHDGPDDGAVLTAQLKCMRAKHVVRLRMLAGGESGEIARRGEERLG